MTSAAKRSEELSYVRQLVSTKAFPHSGELFSAVVDPPDVELRTASGVIAIEVTKLYQPADRRPMRFEDVPRQVFESICQSIVRELSQRCDDERVGPARFMLTFAEPIDYRGCRRERVKAFLFEELKRAFTRCPIVGRESTRVREHGLGLIGIVVIRHPAIVENEFLERQIGGMMPIAQSGLSEVIAAKAARLPVYSSRYSECHLLVVIPQGGISSVFSLKSLEALSATRAAFHSAWLLDERTKMVVAVDGV